MKRTRLSDQIAETLEKMISEGQLQPGQRLKSERELAVELDVSRPSLREAIQKLNLKGILTTKRGGGTFVCEKASTDFIEPLNTMLVENPESRFDVLEVRHALEGTAAYYAALRGTTDEKAEIIQCFEKMIRMHGSPDPMDEARADAAFHLSIVKASHNEVLLNIMQGLFNLLQNSISHNLDKLYTIPRVFEPLSNQHRRLMNTILEGDPEKARLAAQEHLVFVEESLQQIDREVLREQRELRNLSDSTSDH
ncbi:MAG: FCD domain-containing protein [Chromatiales bacterium]|nr:FCD domain-containing protein [Chromatiales bacterium]